MREAVQEGLTGADLLAALRSLEACCIANAAGLPKGDPAPEIWAGVLFRLADWAMVASLGEIGEVLDLPREITRIPATRPWVAGIANNRGTLLPIFDLQAFLLGPATPRGPRNRVMVVRQEEFPFGLLVGDVIGIRHFDVSSRAPAPELPPLLASLVVGGFRQGAREYPIFSASRLAADARFAQAAA